MIALKIFLGIFATVCLLIGSLMLIGFINLLLESIEIWFLHKKHKAENVKFLKLDMTIYTGIVTILCFGVVFGSTFVLFS